jgi:TRAP-type C4-dicarboxylate transport system permease small subunit
MGTIKIAGVVLTVAGLLGLAYGGFSYTKETHDTRIGPLELSVKDRERVNVPMWAGVAAVVAGGVLLVMPRKA